MEDLFNTTNVYNFADWSNGEIEFAKKVYENDIDYVKKHWMNIDKLKEHMIMNIGAMTNGIDSESAFMFLNEKWKIQKNYIDSNRYTCLHMACEFNDKIEVVKYLINEIGYDPNSKLPSGCNCLMLACASNKNEEIIKYLLTKVDPNIKDICDDSCLIRIFERFDLSYEIKIHMLEMKEIILNEKIMVSCLRSSCARGSDCEIIKYLFEKWDKLFDKNQSEHKILINEMLLESAKYNKNLHVIKYLMEYYHADPNYLNRDGDNCLTGSCWRNDNLDVIKYFINDLKMDISHCDNFGNDCFLAACMNETNPGIVKYLVTEVKVDVNKKNSYHRNGLSIVMRHNKKNYSAMMFLINETNIDVEIAHLPDVKRMCEILSIIDDYDKINRTIEKMKDLLESKTISHVVTMSGINPFTLTNDNKMMLNINPLDTYNYKECVKLINELKEPVHIPKIGLVCQHQFVDNDVDENNLLEAVFKNNGSIYYGSRKKVFNAMHLFNDMDDMIKHDEVIELEGKISEKAINEYINSCYVGKIRLELVQREEFINFIKFIDQYPTKFVSIDQIENQIIQYIDKNKIVYCDYLKDVCNKYELKSMYLDIHNKKNGQCPSGVP